MRSWRTIRDQSCLRALNGILLALLLTHSTALAVQMKEDPKGFEGIPWGATLSESETFGKVEDSGRLKTYELKGGPPTFGPAKVESMKFTTVDDRFARVTVRYQGKEAHDQLLGFLQSRYGPLDRTPGQFAGGAVKIFAWQGVDAERLLVVVNYAPNQSQCHIRIPFGDLRDQQWRLADLLGEARYDWNGNDLESRGLYVDMAAWQAQVFSMTKKEG